MKSKINIINCILLLFLFNLSCENKPKEVLIKHNINGIILYQLECEEKPYFSFEKCNCENLPQSYFSPIGDSDSYYSINLRKKKGRLEVYLHFNDVIKRGNILEQIKIEKDINNTFFYDSLAQKTYFIDGTSRVLGPP